MLILKKIYYILILSGFFLLLIRWKKLDSRVHIYLGILACAFFTEKIRDWYYPQAIATYIYHLYEIIEMGLLSLYYYLLFQRKLNRQLVITGSLVYFFFFIYLFVFQRNNFFTDTRIDVAVENAWIAVFSILYLLELYQQDNPVVLRQSPHFWIVLANLIFSSGGLFFHGYTYYLLIHKIPVYQQLSFIIIALNYFLYTSYIIAFLCREKTEIS